jgi:hypothetical protein
VCGADNPVTACGAGSPITVCGAGPITVRGGQFHHRKIQLRGGGERPCIIPHKLPYAAAIDLRFGDMRRYVNILKNLAPALVLSARREPILTIQPGITDDGSKTQRARTAPRVQRINLAEST